MNNYNNYNNCCDIFKRIQTNIYHIQPKKQCTNNIPPPKTAKKNYVMPPNKKINIVQNQNRSRCTSKNAHERIKSDLSPSRTHTLSKDKKIRNDVYSGTARIMQKITTLKKNAMASGHKKQRSTVEGATQPSTLHSPSRPRTPDLSRKGEQKRSNITRTPDRGMYTRDFSRSPLRVRTGSCVTHTNVKKKSNAVRPITTGNNYPCNYNYGKTARVKPTNQMTMNNYNVNIRKNNTANNSNFKVKNIKTKEEEIFQSFGKYVPYQNKPQKTQQQKTQSQLQPQYYHPSQQKKNNYVEQKNYQNYNQKVNYTNINTNYGKGVFSPTNNTQGGNGNYELPNENKIEFNELDQFSPPFLGQQLDLNYKEQRTNNPAYNYTNIEMLKHNTLNACPMTSNRQIIDDFLSQMETGKKYSTIEYKNYPFAMNKNKYK